MANYLERIIRRDMETAQTWQQVAGWVLILLGGGVLVGITFVMTASVFDLIEFTPLSVSTRVFMGIFILTPILVFDAWLVRRFIQYRQSRKWLAEYKRENPPPYRTEQD